jgi:hypothetical protein
MRPAPAFRSLLRGRIFDGRAKVERRSDVLVTGDQDLIVVAEAALLPILDPRGFWNLLSKGR